MPSEPRARDLAFGLIVVGDEILSGKREDRHFPRFLKLLAARGGRLAWHWTLPDTPEILVDQLRLSMGWRFPVFSCGGIGATPDDHTRACAAAAAGVALELHPGAVEAIEARFGAEAYPVRIRMADLPEGSELIPNPYNRIPGFSLREHFFLPGFPEMAWPMAQWVLDTRFPPAEAAMRECSLRVHRVPESRLVPIMEQLVDSFPGLKLFSLPRLGERPAVEVGFRGHEGIEQAYRALREALDREGFEYEATDRPHRGA